jgi:hypothetical protein
MKNAILATLVLGSAALTSCVDPYYGQPAGGPPVYHPSPGYGRGAYQDGLNDGARDARNGRSYNLRGQYSLPQHLRDEYRSGYNAGYRRADGGGWHGGDRPGEARFYGEGFSDAQRDRRNGRSYNPSRHWSNVPPRARDEFNRGYAAGWSRRY